ncbi:unnamed protein product [Adineta steineri]|uniref:Uncharacterized protein n=1 Tax=Adineta steineri TaxID=433720 RepID=A0A814Z8A0_9BILA|nr:unnamed protein product [Adineta steineri]CAF1273720.1 unnamed protein product [Adineta steineri]CAF1328802.1 unnamed protein product [Adineta steineri]CAF3530567.1 unnamed protein product [Adineta steineri]CAF3636950.1 unnamed protein product [Adineta steineri]
MDRRRLSVFANFVGYSDRMGDTNQINSEQRRLSDGPFPPSLRRPFPYQYYHYPGEFVGSDTCMLKRKNSSLNMLLDSTSSMMRTASSTFQCLIGSARRASYCGQPDPSVQLAPNGTSGSLYLRSGTANSNESSLSNASFDDQRRVVTIYDGRIPSTPTAPTIPFELLTPIEAITRAVDDPVESFVQIVLETPDDKPPMMPPISSSLARMNLSSRRRHRSSSPNLKPTNQRTTLSSETYALPKLTQHQSMPTREFSNSTTRQCQIPDVIEPMDFSFLEPVLRGESAAPPLQSKSFQNSSTLKDSSIHPRTSSYPPIPLNHIITNEHDLTSSESISSGDEYNYYVPPYPRLKFTPSID